MPCTRRAVVAAVGVAVLLSASACGGDEPVVPTTVEVFTWWADGGEKGGLDGLVSTFGTTCAGQTFQNGAVAGGGGADAKQVLAARLQQSDPPDTFQVHAGAELLDYVDAGQIEDLSADYDAWGLKQAFPQGLIDNLTVDGKIYSVPANIHRANVVWSNKTVVAAAGITEAPRTLPEFFAALEKVKAAGQTPLALGQDWTQLMLFESVLITNLGPDKFTGLWNGGTSWSDPAVSTSIADYRKLLGYTNADRDSLDWTDAEKLVVDGKAAYQLMGDWEAADLDAKGFQDYGYFTFPGNGDTFQWLADSFVLPKGAKNTGGTKCWLQTVGSAEGQRAFNTKKGSVPARIDAEPGEYPAYQRAAMADWRSATQVPSCAHGSACSLGWSGAINAVLGGYSVRPDDAGLQHSLVATAEQFIKK